VIKYDNYHKNIERKPQKRKKLVIKAVSSPKKRNLAGIYFILCSLQK